VIKAAGMDRLRLLTIAYQTSDSLGTLVLPHCRARGDIAARKALMRSGVGCRLRKEQLTPTPTIRTSSYALDPPRQGG